jgi:CheY-like chemotaxis protein
MSAGVIARVFEPFFTTRAVGVGKGLGLSLCHSVVTGMGGQITVTSTEGVGTTFRVALPAAAPVPVTAAVAGGTGLRRGAVLVVDDDPLVAVVLGRALQAHDVTTVTTAAAALDLLGSGRRFDVILADLMMPGMSGMELFDECARRFPAAAERMVFVTGGAALEAGNAFLDRVANRRVEKPFDMIQIRTLVRTFVD